MDDCPAAHAVQLIAPSPVNVLVMEPAGHTAHATVDTLLYRPAAHAVHVVPLALTAPVPAPISTTDPAGHAVQGCAVEAL